MALTIISMGAATGGNYPERIAIYIGVEVISQDVTNNRGTYRIKTWLKNNTTWAPWNTWPGDNPYYLKVDGTTIKSGTQFVDFRKSSEHVIADETITRDHDANGNLSFVIETRQAITNVSTFDYAYRKGTFTAPQIKRASKVTAGTSNVDAAIPITITPEQSGVLHDIVVKYGSTVIKTLTGQTTPTSITLTAAEWTNVHNLTKTVTSFNLAIQVTTKLNGANIGTNTANATINYPGTVIPTVGSISVSDSNTTVSSIVGTGIFLKLLSNLTVQMNSVSGAKGSTISEYELIINGTNYGAVSRTFKPPTSGAYAVKARVKDSRGRWSAQKTFSFTVTDYSRPSIANYNVVRSNSAGVFDTLGTYSKHTGSLAVKSLIISGSEKNHLRYKIDKVSGSTVTNILTTQTVAGVSKNISHVLGTYSIDTAQKFRVTAYDRFNEAVSADFTLPTARVPFTLSKFGVGIGGIYDNNDSATAQVFGDLKMKRGTVITGTDPLNVDTVGGLSAGGGNNRLYITQGETSSSGRSYIELWGPENNSSLPERAGEVLMGGDHFVWRYKTAEHTGAGLEKMRFEQVNGKFLLSFVGAGAVDAQFEPRAIGANSDLNNIQTPGMYYVAENATVTTIANTPANLAFSLFVEKHAGVHQTFKTYPTAGPKIFHRSYYAGVWSQWQELGAGGSSSGGITGGNIDTGWEDLPGNLRRCWKTYTTTISGSSLSTTGPTGTYKSAWINPGNWPAAFTSTPRYTQYDIVATAGSWIWRGAIKNPTSTAPGDFFMYKFGATDSEIKVIVEAVGPR